MAVAGLDVSIFKSQKHIILSQDVDPFRPSYVEELVAVEVGDDGGGARPPRSHVQVDFDLLARGNAPASNVYVFQVVTLFVS